jgi:integrase/recombinase XerD
MIEPRGHCAHALYRRHRADCPHVEDRYYRKCRCAMWCEGTLEGKYERHSLKTRSWERAEQLKREAEDGKKPQQPKSVTVSAALDSFIKDCEARNLNRSTLAKYKRLSGSLRNFAALRGVHDLSQLMFQQVIDFRSTWKGSPRTLSKTLERLRAFFKFGVENDWIAKNPAKALKPPQVKILPRLPFSEQEVRNIVANTKDDRELAFILTLQHTGLRIGDAALLRTSQFSENRIHLYTTKAGTPVSVRIPDNLSSLLKAIEPRGGYFFVRGDSTSMHTCADLWRRRIKILCKAAGVAPDHPHRFRHTLAADLLAKGASVEDVAAVLGNSPAVVQKHYSQWIKSRQDRLDSILESTWKPALMRVK